jgi:ubiquinone/menaquinone biosynthesis C-methylase UbiE
MWFVLLIVAALAAAIFWELWVCEGAHLGQRFVVWLYDLTAPYYEGIKQFDPDWEKHFLGEPVARVARNFAPADVLDIGAGTGRLARVLLPLEQFDGHLVSLEPSARMTHNAFEPPTSSKAEWVRSWAAPLPFKPQSFDIVVSLEMMEFVPDQLTVLQEMIRVLRPGGWLLLTNRIGFEARLILGKTQSSQKVIKRLGELGLEDIEQFPWQRSYDIIWARRPQPSWPA